MNYTYEKHCEKQIISGVNNGKSYEDLVDFSVIKLEEALSSDDIKSLNNCNKVEKYNGYFWYTTGTEQPFSSEGYQIAFKMKGKKQVIVYPDLAMQFHHGFDKDDVLKHCNNIVMKIIESVHV